MLLQQYKLLFLVSVLFGCVNGVYAVVVTEKVVSDGSRTVQGSPSANSAEKTQTQTTQSVKSQPAKGTQPVKTQPAKP